MRILLALLFSFAACAAEAQTTVPRLDGHWKIDPARTPGYVGRAGVPDLTLTVHQTDTEVILEYQSKARWVTRYRIGEKTVETIGGQRTTALSSWEPGRLVVIGERARPDGTSTPYRLVIRLGDVDELVMEERLSPPNTDFVATRVFTRIE